MFRYTPYGNITKNITFTVDGSKIGEASTSVTGRQMTYTIPAQKHGAHLLEVVMTSEVNGKQVTSNTIAKDIMWATEGDSTPIISCATKEFTAKQYSNVAIRYAKVSNVMGVQGKFVTDVTYSDGVLNVSKNGEAVSTTLTGVVHAPTYDADTRTIKLPVFGGDELSINFGKDLVVKSGIYNAVDKNIELTITSGDVIKIPVGSLIDIYTGIATASATVSVSDDNKISVSVRVSAKANNSISIEEDGLYVAVPDAYTKAETDEKVKAVKDAISGHESNADIHVTKAQKTSWDAKVSTHGLMSTADKKKLDGFGSSDTYALKSDITAMYRYKGSVASKSDLPTKGNTTGDVYDVGDGMNYAWTGSKWDALGEVFSITDIKNTEIDAALDTVFNS